MPTPFRVKKFLARFENLQKEIFFWLGLGIFVISAGFWADRNVFFWVEWVRSPVLNWGFVFLTEFLIWALFAALFLALFYRVWRHPNHTSKLIPAAAALVGAGVCAQILKAVFRVPRPFLDAEILPISQFSFAIEFSYFSFPSLHTALAFSILVPLLRRSKLIGVFWALFAILIGIGRVYQGVHYPSDIAAGMILGGMIGAVFSHPEIYRFLKFQWENSLEFRRQSFHLVFGIGVVFSHWVGVLGIREIAILLAAGLAVSVISQYQKNIPFISPALKLFDRKRDQNFPGRGAFYFLLGTLICFLAFPLKVAYAAILIMSVGDSLNHLIGKNFGGQKIFWNPKKNWFGAALGILGGAFAAQFFVGVWPAFLASGVSILLETFTLKVGKFFVDDNLVVPISAGIVLMICQSLGAG